MNPNEIKKTIEINASPEHVFKAISDENELKKWWVDVPKIQHKVGGNLLFRFLKEKSANLKQDFVIEGKIIEYVPNQKLSYTWKPADNQNYPDTLVTWMLENLSNNKTKVAVIHSGLEEISDYSQLEAGWSYFIERLGNLLNNQK